MKFDEKSAGIAYSLSAGIPIIFQLISLLICNMILGSEKTQSITTSNVFLWCMLFLNQLAFFVTSFSIIARKKIDFISELGLRKNNFNYKYCLLGIIFTVALVFFMSPIVEYFVEFLKMLGYTPSQTTLPTEFTWYNYLLGFIIVCILPAIFEEVLFRGIILSGTKRISHTFAIIVSSLLFALMHQRIEQMLHQFIFAVVLSYIAIKQRSIIIPIIMHFVNNLLVLTIGYMPISMLAVFIAMGIGGALVIGIILFEFLYLRKTANYSTSDDIDKQQQARVSPKLMFFLYALGGILFNFIMLMVGLFS